MNQPVPKKTAKPSAKRQTKPKTGRKTAAPVQKSVPPAKEVRHCGACDGQVALKARYCRHCGLALSPDVPGNPFLPPPPKPWRPSRIPRQRPQVAAPTAQAPLVASPPELAHTQALAPQPSPAARPKPAAAAPARKPQVWDPLPEVERRMAELAQLHEKIKPQLARAEMRRRRVPMQ
ncbi:MAG: hypothetical protein RIT26_2549 [Pseudomonadota bacterium]|jgi:hypothetical protein